MRDTDKAKEQRDKAKVLKVKEEPKVQRAQRQAQRQVLRQALRKKKRKRSSAAVCGTAVRDF
jgi:hypothetical protein